MLSSGLFIYLSFMKIQKIHELFLQFPTPCTDTRKITPNCIFFALKGENFNGNRYAEQAIKNGAVYAIVDEATYANHSHAILVENVLETLQQLATFHRRHFKTKVIALTGSNGKTTTKELVHAILSTTYKTTATIGNLNNHIGVPLTLLSIQKDTEIAIVEMGANHQEEIAFLCKIAEPDFGYITNFGKAHLEGFGGVEGVIKGKSELYDFLNEKHKFIFFNADDPIQVSKVSTYKNSYGFSQNDVKYYQINLRSADPFVSIEVEQTIITSKLIGAYNFLNCCAAIAIGKYFNVSLENRKKGIENYVPSNNRSQLIDKNGHQIILDAYNANPSSMQVALENFHKLDAKHKTVFLGDMFELGNSAKIEHQKIADLATSMEFDSTFFVGKNFSATTTKEKIFETFDDLSYYLKNNNLEKSAILIKGSRGMALERLIALI